MAIDYRDFYIKYPENNNYSSDIILTETKTDMIINKIEMVLFTNKGEFIADADFGCNLEYYVRQTRVSAATIDGIIRDQFSKYIPELNSIGYTLNVSLMAGTIQDILIVDVSVADKAIQAVLL